MAEINYTTHLKFRLKIRRIPYDYPKTIFENPEERFFDNLEKTKIAIKSLNIIIRLGT